MFDVIVIGGGVVGGLTLRELAKYQLSCCMLEKESDVCMGASKANSGIVHAGFDAAPGSLKAKFNVEGNRMMPSLCAELGVKYRNNGSLVVAFSDEETCTLKELKERGVWVCGTAADGDTSLYRADLKGPTAIVIGSEGDGMTRLVREKCDFLVSIPMKGKISSLNASAAAAILLYEAVRQRLGQ